MNKIIVQAMKKAKKLISKPETWTKRAYARDINDQYVSYKDPEAYKFCISGAIDRAFYEIDVNIYEYNQNNKFQHINEFSRNIKEFTNRKPSASTEITKYEEFEDFTQFNDDPETTHEEIIQLLDHAIKTFSKGDI